MERGPGEHRDVVRLDIKARTRARQAQDTPRATRLDRARRAAYRSSLPVRGRARQAEGKSAAPRDITRPALARARDDVTARSATSSRSPNQAGADGCGRASRPHRRRAQGTWSR